MEQTNTGITNDELREEYLSLAPYELAPACDQSLFTPEELEVIRKYGHWFDALCKDKVSLETERQKQFVHAQGKGVEPKSAYERLWYRYTTARDPFLF